MLSQINYLQSSADVNCKIAVRSGLPKIQAESVVLILHGATLPSIIFDLAVFEGHSMLSYIAENGIAAYSLDYRGYGLSSKPIEMDSPPVAGNLLITHIDAVVDVHDVLKFINEQHPGKPIVFCGFSWGSTIAGYIASTTNLAKKLILLGPVYSYKNPQWLELANPNDNTNLNPAIKNYRIALRERWCGLWDRELASNQIFWRDPKVLEELLNHVEKSDSNWANLTGKIGCIRIPTGVLADALRVYNQNPIYDASKITCPTLVLRGDHDSASLAADVSGIINTLTCHKQLINVDNATHYGILERGAGRFFKAIIDFINH